MPWSAGQRRRSPRVEVALTVELSRERGNPVAAHTVDLGDHGMRVASSRPLAVDEVLRFDLALGPGDEHLDGSARVVREHARNVYALVLEELADHDALLLSRFVARAG